MADEVPSFSDQGRETGVARKTQVWRDLAYVWGPDNADVILAQCPTARFVASWLAWQAMGRTVRHGERGIKVVNPRRPEYLTVFDVYQTEQRTDGGKHVH
jgi:hypothetical protein